VEALENPSASGPLSALIPIAPIPIVLSATVVVIASQADLGSFSMTRPSPPASLAVKTLDRSTREKGRPASQASEHLHPPTDTSADSLFEVRLGYGELDEADPRG